MSVELCPSITFGFTTTLVDGVTVMALESLEPTLVTPSDQNGVGECKHICGDLAFDRSTGTMRVVFETCGVQCVSDFGVLTEAATPEPEGVDPLEPVDRGGEQDPLTLYGPIRALGTLVSPTRGVLCGSIVVFTTTSDCTQNRDEGCPGIGLPDDEAPPMRPECFHAPPDGLDCIYCTSQEDDECTIEQTGGGSQATHTPCGALGNPGRSPIAIPGARVYPDPGSWDVTQNDSLFQAHSGVEGLVRYYLKPLTGAVDPIHPDPTFGGVGDCCTWLCGRMTANVSGRAWEVHCNTPLQAPPGEPRPWQERPRRITVVPGPGPITYVHFNMFGSEAPCFPLWDQTCFTHGGGSDYWGHLSEGDDRLNVLHSLAVDFNCRMSTDNVKFPHAEPEYVTIANDALATMATRVGQIQSPGHFVGHWYDAASLNLWTHGEGWACDVADAVRRSNGDPWTVYVTPYGTNCRFPADLIVSRVVVSLRISAEPSSFRLQPPAGEPVPGVRLPAVIDVWVFLKPRLRDGWEQIDCPVSLPFGNDSPCVDTDDANVPVVVSSDNCSQVPLAVKWRGLNGPRPWSRSLFLHTQECEEVTDGCCDVLFALDGLLIDGEVNDTSDPDSPQRYEGDVVLMLNTAPSELGCGC